MEESTILTSCKFPIIDMLPSEQTMTYIHDTCTTLRIGSQIIHKYQKPLPFTEDNLLHQYNDYCAKADGRYTCGLVS